MFLPGLINSNYLPVSVTWMFMSVWLNLLICVCLLPAAAVNSYDRNQLTQRKFARETANYNNSDIITKSVVCSLLPFHVHCFYCSFLELLSSTYKLQSIIIIIIIIYLFGREVQIVTFNRINVNI